MTRILHIADLHFGREHRPLVDAFTGYCLQNPPGLIVATGDFTQGARRREFAAARQFLDNLPSPVVGAPGNHDVPSRALDHRFFTPWQRFERVLGGRIDPRIETETVLGETLHTARRAQMRLDWSLGRVSRTDALVLSRKLENGTQAMKFVACHHPLLAPGGARGRARTKRGEDAAEILAGAADLVLSGHLHQTFALPMAGQSHVCWFVGASTTFSERTRDEPSGFNEILIEADRMELIHHESRDASRFVPARRFELPRRPGDHTPKAVDLNEPATR
ncbi:MULTISPECIES: metallophosphoesterase family protein [Hyphobacterium]|uniref:Metallophosphoesterase family protein n=1 Tax=Hyphobacterium vulgare TaxID=1736751 RepID=A0ABV6ZT36_9PROT